MKKLFLMTAIGVASFMNAKTISPKNGGDKKLPHKKELTSITEKKHNFVTTNFSDYVCLTVAVSCTTATTCQDWSADQWYAWARRIQANYCTIEGAFYNSL